MTSSSSSMFPSGNGPSPVKRVAVIAVHGIADQAPGDTVRAVADLLLRLEGSGTVKYMPCVETGLRIPVAPVEVNNKDCSQKSAATTPPRKSRLQERSDYVLRLQNPVDRPQLAAACATSNVQPPEDYGHHFMREQLKGYVPRSEDKVYSTPRLATQRREAGVVTHDLHLYEVYWGDLSRLGTGALRILGELFQLLFHLSSLGRHTVDFALSEHLHDRSVPSWRAFSFFQTWATRCLTLVIPILNLFLFCTLLMLLLTGLSTRSIGLISLVVAGLTALVATAVLLRRKQVLPWPLWAVAPVLATTAATALVFWLETRGLIAAIQVLMVEWAVVAGTILVLVLSAYERRRPGALSIGAAVGALVTVPFLWLIARADETYASVVDVSLPVVEGLFIVLEVAWVVLALLTIGSLVTGVVAVWTTPPNDPSAKSRAKRAAETAWLTISLPSVLFLFVTVIGYRVLDIVLLFSLNDVTKNHTYRPSLLKYFPGMPTEISVTSFLDQMIAAIGTPGFIAALYLILLALLLTVWGLFPSILADARVSRTSTQPSASALGKWLTDGYRLLYFAAGLFLLAFPFALSGGWIYWAVTAPTPGLSTERLAATVIVGSLGGLLAFHGRLEKLALGFRPALDAILDVDNYLREHPNDNNPRSRICARYVSLLRYVCAYRDPQDGAPYSGLIIVSHSQGTVISAELLRFLRTEYDPTLSCLGVHLDTDTHGEPKLPIYLITMGCPLRQLYGWRFPHLYRWARHDDDLQWQGPHDIPDDQLPDPTELGIKRWVNGFRSGDYVGRYLWRTYKRDHEWDTLPSKDSTELRREFCIGAGAHTHYFDDTAPAVARELDRVCEMI